MNLTIIAAISENNVIGKDGGIPWQKTKESRKKYREDTGRFSKLTTGHPVIMGRKTYESFPKSFRPLPNRPNLIVTSKDEGDFEEGIIIARTLEEALGKADELDENVYSIGGERIYRESLPYANRMELTRIDGKYEGDAFFPVDDVDWDNWNLIEKVLCDGFTFETYDKK